jgi:hypothetical protein
MIWDSHSSHLEEPNVNEREWAMGFHTNTTTMPDLLEGARRHILKQIMDFNYLTWGFNFCLVE